MRFEAQASSDPDGQLVSYQWEFGDGSSASGEQVTHTYNAPGEYIVTLKVEDNAGLEDGSIRTLQLEPRFLPIILR